ncbi:Vacuolar membrane protease [Coelomomyces lativittatus]|nr:Vacuolar membrane protease [Coelomomyces lativittatus]
MPRKVVPKEASIPALPTVVNGTLKKSEDFTSTVPSSPLRKSRSLRRSNSISLKKRTRSKSKSNVSATSKESLVSSSSSSSSSTSSLTKVTTKTQKKLASTSLGMEIEALSIYTHPWKILKGFLGYLIYKVNQTTKKATHRLHFNLAVLSVFVVLLTFIYTSEHPLVLFMEQKIRWYSSWILLGILSSVGLGTGLHTFIMFLGPHIAQVTTAAYSCGHLDFKTDVWEKVQCVPLPHPESITLLQVANLVKWESFLWGLGTALGELPPYFVAKAANDTDTSHKLDPFKNRMAKWIHQFGFWSILVFASVPNPLFDLAGIICGSCGIPLSTFFLATFLGKAINKTSLQVFFVVTLFSPSGRKVVLDFLSTFSSKYHDVFQLWLEKEMRKYFNPATSDPLDAASFNWIAFVWNSFIFLMLLFFIFSIVESLAKRHLKRQITA